MSPLSPSDQPATREPILLAVFSVRNAALLALLWLSWRSAQRPGPGRAATPVEAIA